MKSICFAEQNTRLLLSRKMSGTAAFSLSEQIKTVPHVLHYKMQCGIRSYVLLCLSKIRQTDIDARLSRALLPSFSAFESSDLLARRFSVSSRSFFPFNRRSNGLPAVFCFEPVGFIYPFPLSTSRCHAGSRPADGGCSQALLQPSRTRNCSSNRAFSRRSA